jgi:hypothetical protein
VGFAGVIVGASLQFLYGRRSERWKQFLTARTQAYVDYIAWIAELGRTRANPAKLEEISAKGDNAVYRICVLGSKAVVDALAEFESLRRGGTEEDKRKRFLMLCARMREDTSTQREMVDLAKLGGILWEP